MTTQTLQLAHPRFWLSWVAVALMTLTAYLPQTSYQPIARGLTRLLKPFLQRRWKIAEKNLSACFPELPKSRILELAETSIESTIQGYLESVRSWRRPLEPYKNRLTIEGLEHVEAALKAGKGIVIAGGHFSILDLAGALFSLHYPLNITYRPLDNPVMNWFMMKGRQRWAKACYEPKNMRDYIACLKRGDILWYAPDQDFGSQHSVFAPFFGIPTATVKGLTIMARRSGATVLTASFFREAKGTYRIRIRPPLAIPSGSFESDAGAFNKRLEEEIRRDPSQYYWVHRRFKSRPPNTPAFY
jgi:KDO2-lipid IV(A) lauroyltransferase